MECFVTILDKKRISLDLQDAYMGYWRRCGQLSSDYSFMVIYAWDKALEYSYFIQDDLIWLEQGKPEPLMLAPVGSWQREDWEDVLFRAVGDEATFYSVPEKLAQIWSVQLGDKIAITEDRDAFEYLYNYDELSALKGNKYMKKRNRINQFAKAFPYKYVHITKDIIPKVIGLQKAWCSGHDCCEDYFLRGEHRGILAVLENWDNLRGILGGAIEVGENLVAYTIAEKVSADELMIHFEKGHPDYPQVYQVINRDFLANLPQDAGKIKIVNREEDMGNAGMREAKMSYMPVGFLKKYKAVWKK